MIKDFEDFLGVKHVNFTKLAEKNKSKHGKNDTIIS